MRFRFLGTGTSSGIPAIGCACHVCTSTDPRDTRLRTSACIETRDERGRERMILIDAGPDLRQQALTHKLTRCDAILFTHNHVDHTFGLDEVRRFNAVQGSAIDVYAERHTLEHLQRVYRHIFDRDKNVNDSFVATLIAHQIAPGLAIEMFGLRVTPIRLLHGKLPILGYRFDRMAAQVDVGARGPGSLPLLPGGGRGEVARDADERGLAERENLPPTPSLKEGENDQAGTSPQEQLARDPFPLAYCTDVSGIPPDTWSVLTGLRTLVLDALRHRRHPTHFTVDEAVNVASRVGAEQTYFIHMAHELKHADTDAALPEGMQLAHDGLVLGSMEP